MTLGIKCYPHLLSIWKNGFCKLAENKGIRFIDNSGIIVLMKYTEMDLELGIVREFINTQ